MVSLVWINVIDIRSSGASSCSYPVCITIFQILIRLQDIDGSREKVKNNREHLTLSRLLICWKLSPACWRPRVSWCCGSRAVSRRRILVRPILKLCTITLTRRTSLTLWYPRHQLQLRIGYFFGAASLAGAFSGLLAFAISFMSGTRGLLGWSWIFVSGSCHTIPTQRLIHFIDH